MKKILISMLAVAMGVMTFTACDSNDDVSETSKYTKIPIAESATGVTTSANEFALNVYKSISAVKQAENICTSPYSIFTALSMAANGDDATTRDELIKLLRLSGVSDIETLNSFNATLLEYLPKVDKSTTCLVANSVWYNPAFQIVPAFGNNLNNYYKASSFDVSPAGTDGMAAINKWIKENTNGMISSFLDQPFSSNLALINAAYFNGLWSDPFAKSATKSGGFNNADGSAGTAEYMYKSSDIMYYASDNMQMVKLPYGSGNFAMYAILPAENVSLSSFVSSLSATELSEGINRLNSANVTLRLPRFTAEYKGDVMSCVEALGLSSKSLKAALTQNNAAVSTEIANILHGAKIVVNELGTEAAAATVIGELTDAGVSNKVTLSFDRPFLYVIEEVSTGTILFIGQQVKM